jgi:sugar lactone lactonase YvrE
MGLPRPLDYARIFNFVQKVQVQYSAFPSSTNLQEISKMTRKSTVSAYKAIFASLSVSTQICADRNLSSSPWTWRRGIARARGFALLATALMLLGVFQVPAQAQVTLAPNWVQQSPVTSPPATYNGAMAYDSAHGQVVMFAGGTSNTWLWNGTTWFQASPATVPSARSNQAMAYDPMHGQVVMFGGIDSGSTRLNDTWLWNGTNWTNVVPATSPSARDGATMVYDAALGGIVLFGGINGSGTIIGDTWLWNGTTWASVSSGQNPAARFSHAMAYDAAHSQVVLFGGFNGSELNDTWVLTGTGWAQLAPATSPGGRDSHGMDYDAALGQVVMFGGYNGSAYVNDTWTWNGTNWTLQSPAASPSPSYATNAMVYDAEEGGVVMFGGYNGGSFFNTTWVWGTGQNFGNVNVCPSGQSTPAPCSNTLPLTFNFASTTTISSINAVTQGASGFDFAQANGGNCAGTISAGNSCTLDVTFTPQEPGMRMGAVQITDSVGNVSTTPINGVGQGPEIVFGPAFSGTTILSGPALEAIIGTLPYAVNPRGMATDAAGDLFIADPSNERLLMRAANGTTTTVGTLGFPQDVAVDGAGDLFVADTGLQEVVEIPAGCFSAACQVSVYNPPAADPVAMALDGQGDLFIADSSAGGVIEVPAGCGNSSCYVPVGSGWHSVNALAVDAAGDLFVTDSSAGSVSKMPAGCTSNSCRVGFGPGWIVPQGIAVDAAGDVYVSDTAAAGGMGAVFEVPAGCASSSCEVALVTGIFAYHLTVDELGQVYIGDGGNHQVLRVTQSFTALNVGNQTLSAILPGFAVAGVNFYQVSGTAPGVPPDCYYGFSLAPGAGCNASISFIPQIPGLLSSTGTFTDNSLNGNPATQIVALSGTAFAAVQTLTLTGAGTGNGSVVANPTGINCGITGGVASGPTCSSSYPGGTLVLLQEVPSSGYAFVGWGGACSNSGTNQVCSVTLNTSTSASANFAPAPNYPLQVTMVGTGTGTVSSDTGGIACSLSGGVKSGTCSASFAIGTQVVLTAIPSGNTIFVGWGGDCASSGAGLICMTVANSALNITASYAAPGASQAGILKPITAGVVYGQGGSFTTNSTNNGGISANSLDSLADLAFDSSGNLYVSDALNARVLFYPAGSTTATRVYGQNGSFTTNIGNKGGVSANSLWGPQGIALDSSGNLYVADGSNDRVLFYPAGSTTATRVYGQGGSFTTNIGNKGGVSANSLSAPEGIALDSSGNLYVADQSNNRVLFYPAGSTTATQVYGQGGSFTSNALNNGGLSANSLNQPTGVALDSGGDLYVADDSNNRVLFYPFGSTIATQVYGQPGFTTNYANNGGVSASSLNNPIYPTLDSSGNLYVADTLNNRVLFYPFGSTTATRVYGQLNSFTSTAANNGGISANSLSEPWAVALDPSGNLYVTDNSNNRVLEYGNFGNVNVCPNGVTTPAPCNTTISMSYYAATTTNFGATQVVTQGFTGLDFAPGGGSTCTGAIAAGNTCTVNVNFAPLAPGLISGAVQLYDSGANLLTTAPIYGIGQGPEIAFGPGTQTALVGIDGVHAAREVALDGGGNFFIAEDLNDQVVELPAGGGPQTTVGTGLNMPYGVAVDGAGDIFIADTGNNRVVEVPASGGPQTTVGSGLSSPYGLAVDGAGDLFIADSGNSRVAEVPAGCASAACQTTVGSGLGNPLSVAVDGAGDVFAGNGSQVEEVPAGCANAACQTTVATGLIEASGVTVDPAGDVFITDTFNSRVLEIPAGCASVACQTTVGAGFGYPYGVAVDRVGDVFITDTNDGVISEINRSLPPSFNFALTNVGSVSGDSPQALSALNIGNQTLTGSLAINLNGNFVVNSGSTCTSGFSLAPGASCSESFSFFPQTTGYLTGTAGFSDNTLNLSPFVSLQTISLTGNGGLNGQAVGVMVPNVVGLTQAAAAAPLTGAGLAMGTVSTASSNVVPSGSVIASNPAAGTQVSIGSAVRLLVSTGQAAPPTPNPLSLENNYFVTGDYASAGVTLRGLGIGGMATEPSPSPAARLILESARAFQTGPTSLTVSSTGRRSKTRRRLRAVAEPLWVIRSSGSS